MSNMQMTDLETMSVRGNALIISMGFCRFDPTTKEISDELLLNIDFRKTLANYPGKFHIDPGTVEWWGNQDRAVLNSIYSNQIPLEEAIDKIYKWIFPDQEIWCWGASFDFPILEHAIRVTGKDKEYNTLPWKFYNFRCARTIASVFDKKTERSSGHHNALADCIDQSKLMIDILSN